MTSRGTASVLAILLLVGAVAGGVVWRSGEATDQVSLAVAGTYPDGYGASARAARPLAGRTVVIDPGHQLGNHNYPRQINRQVPAGGFTKPCNTTGTATNGGYPEATFAWQVARRLRARLLDLGADVVLTRHSNRQDRWGPCVDERGRDGNGIHADLKVSIHGDGSYASGAHGFHVIAPTDRRPWTHDIYRSSRRLALDTRAALRGAGVPVANYIAGGDGLDFRSDLATLNLSDIPTVMVELGNMRDSRDAHRMTTDRGRATYAGALARAVRTFLG
ncbi:MAG: N-acetylmuramoyl-L-alanine amidase family protein [Nocardioides sp.]